MNTIHTIRLTLFCGIALLAFTLGATRGMAQVNAPEAPSGTARIESILAPDGTLDLSRTFAGSFDASGYMMLTDSAGTPRFVQSEASLMAAPGDELWDDRFGPPGTNGVVYSVVVRGSDIFIGGDFEIAGTTLAHNVARWSTTTRTWSVLGDESVNGVGGPVYAMTVYGNNLYVGGIFESAGYVRASGIARWDITRGRWSSLGGGVAEVVNTAIFNGYVYAIAADSSGVYVGGQFLMADADSVYNLARWDNASQSWAAACKTDANRTDGTIRALALAGGSLYVGGEFSAVADIRAQRIARWDLNSNTWHPLDAGLNGTVRAIAVDGSRLIVGGDFTASGTTQLRHIAGWDGTRWTPLGPGLDGNVHVIHIGGGRVYAGGTFAFAGNIATNAIARWDGGAWSPMSIGMADTASTAVYGITSVGGDVYAGGRYSTAGFASAFNIAQWDTLWTALGSTRRPVLNGTDGAVQAVAIDGDAVYVGGDFSTAGGVPAARIARWSRSTGLWSALGTGITGDGTFVRALAIGPNGDLYVGGIFTAAGGVPSRGIARWSGARWLPLRQGVEGTTPYVFALAIQGSDLFVGGAFSGASGVASPKVLRWGITDSAWHAVGTGIVGDTTYTYVSTVAAGAGEVYVGGEFSLIGALRVDRIARWNGSSWSALGAPGAAGLNATASALALDGARLIVGGEFTRAGALNARYLAAWDGTAWAAFDSMPNGPVRAIAVLGRRMLVGGQFTQVGLRPFGRVALYDLDARTWSQLGSVNGPVSAVAGIDDELFAGGLFSGTSDTRAANIAQWRSGGWSSLGSDPSIGVAGPIYAVAVSGTGVYVGGAFRTSGGVRTNGIARWSDDRWLTVGTGIRGGRSIVRALLVAANGDLFVGGSFDIAGTDSAANLARWDGRRWYPVGAGVRSTLGRTPAVNALAIDGSWLYVGGVFDRAGAMQAHNVARVNLTTGVWEPLGAGVLSRPEPWLAPTVYALGISGGRVFVGGRFDTAGGVASRNLAVWESSGWTPSAVNTNDTSISAAYAIAVNGAEVSVGTGYRAVVGRDVISGHKIYRLRGGTWAVIDSSGGLVYALAYDTRGRLYVGGWFGFVGRTTTQSIARLDGTTWTTMGSGLLGLDFNGRFSLGSVYALQPDGANLWVGGDFQVAGMRPSYYFARWTGAAAGVAQITGPVQEHDVNMITCAPNPSVGKVEITFRTDDETDCAFELVDTRGTVVATRFSRSVPAGLHVITWDMDAAPAGYYTLVLRTADGRERTIPVVRR